MTDTLMLPAPQIRTHGLDAAAWEDYASEQVTAALRQAPAPVRKIRLLISSQQTHDRIDAHVEIDGVVLHAHAAGRTVQEAADLVGERLRGQLRRLRRRPVR
ncbi:MAG TPA: HPF/RaiA family ribosome-associated protein [Actinoplanes sp.]|nr:HPF/RaiA family ribosome-associated protein [Actinoplanes sp.]